MTGGKHERNRRAGTENVPGIAGLGVAARLARGQARRPRRRGSPRCAIASRRGILERGARHGRQRRARSPRVPNTTNISFDGVEAESLLIALDLEGFAVSTGSACSSGTLEPSHVLRAMGLPSHRTQNSLRFSLGAGNTDARGRRRRSRSCPRVVDEAAQPDARGGGADAEPCASSSRCPAASIRRWPRRCSPSGPRRHRPVDAALRSAATARPASAAAARIDDLHDARRVAGTIGIPHYIVNFERKFQEHVIVELRARVRRGPDADSLRALQQRPEVRDAGRARRRASTPRRSPPATTRGSTSTRPTGRYRLKRGVDRQKDQSYFLFSLTQAQLARARFPVGALDKAAVREQARAARPARRRQAGQPGDLLRAGRRPRRRSSSARRRRCRRRRSATATGSVARPPRRRPPLHVGQRKGLGLVHRHPALRRRHRRRRTRR